MFNAVRFVYVLALAVWLGTMVFHSFLVAPTVFASFPRETAGEIVGRLFPRYYGLGLVCGALCAVLPFALWLAGKGTFWGQAALLGAAMWGLTLVAATVIHPRASALRAEVHAGHEAQRAAFARWHRAAVLLNLAVLGTGLGVVWVVSRHID
jgi:uncharacterized membrane protein